MKAISWDACSKLNNRLNLARELVALCFSQLWVIVRGRKLPSSPKISQKVSNASRYSKRGSTQQGPELCYSQGAWRLGNVVAKSVNYVSHRPLSNQQKRIIFSQSWSSKVQIRNRIKTLSIQGHLPPFSSVPWEPRSNLLPCHRKRCAQHRSFPQGDMICDCCLGTWMHCLGRLPAGQGKRAPLADEQWVQTSLSSAQIWKFESFSMYAKHFPADLTNLHWQTFSDSA